MSNTINVQLTPPFAIIPLLKAGPIMQNEWTSDTGETYTVITIGDIVIVAPKMVELPPDVPLVIPGV